MTAAGGNILAWLDRAITLAEADAHYSESEFVYFDVGDEKVADHFQHAGSPTSVLRRCAADRKLLELHRPVILRGGGGARYFETTTVCRSCEPPRQFPEHAYPCPTVLAVAEGYGWTEGEQ